MKKFSIKRCFTIALCAALFFSLLVGSKSFFTDRQKGSVSIRVAEFSKDGYKISNLAPNTPFIAGETVNVTVSEDNKKADAVTTNIQMSATWESPDPDVKIWNNANAADNMVVTLDDQPLEYIAVDDATISFALPQHELPASTNGTSRTLEFVIPASLKSTGNFAVSFDEIIVEQVSGSYSQTFDKAALSDEEHLNFSVRVGWPAAPSDQKNGKALMAYLEDAGGAGEYSIRFKPEYDYALVPMVDFPAESSAPWVPYSNSVTSVFFAEGISSIGDYAFKDFEQTEDVSLPDTLMAVGAYAFDNTSLRTLTIPYATTSFEAMSFGHIDELADITFEAEPDTEVAFPEAGADTGAFYVSTEVETSINAINKDVLSYSWEVDQRKLAQATAVYSADDNSLTFYKRYDAILEDESYNGKTVTAVYKGFEKGTYNSSNEVPWSEVSSTIQSVNFEDEIAPISTAYWFSNMTACESFSMNNLDTSSVTDMSYMFQNCSSITAFKTPVLTEFYSGSEVTFNGEAQAVLPDPGIAVTPKDLAGTQCEVIWDGVKYTSDFFYLNESGMEGVYFGNLTLIDPSLSGGDLPFVGLYLPGQGLIFMDLAGASTTRSITWSGIDQADLVLDTSNAVSMKGMFSGCTSLESFNFTAAWNTEKVEDMSSLFENCTSLTSLSSVSSVIMFEDPAVPFTNNEASLPDTFNLNVEELSGLPLTIVWDSTPYPVSSYINEGVIYFGNLEAIGLATIGADLPFAGGYMPGYGMVFMDLTGSGAATHSVSISYTIAGAFDIDTSSVKRTNRMFANCTSLETLALGSMWDTSGLESMTGMFDGMIKLQQVTLPAGFAFVGSDGYLPAPSAEHISGATGKWYIPRSAIGYIPAEVPSNTATTYTAIEPQMCIQAVFSEEDGSLSFIEDYLYNPGDTFNGKIVTAVYRGFEEDVYTAEDEVPWFNERSQIVSVSFEDEITPISTAYWFYEMTSCSSMDLAKLNTSNVTNMSHMFYDCEGLTELNLSSFNTENVTDMSYMFRDCSSLTKLDLSNFYTEQVTDMSDMFCNCHYLTELDLSSFNTVNVLNMSGMFAGCNTLPDLDVSNFNTEKVTDMSRMFNNCTSISDLNVSNFNTANVTDMSNMFYYCNGLKELDLSNFNTEKVTNMDSLFRYCSGLTELDLSNFNTSSVTLMGYMFDNCKGLTKLDLSNFNTEKVTDMGYMFNNCTGLTKLDLSSFDTSKVYHMNRMFRYCTNLTELDLSTFNTANAYKMDYLFYNCTALKTIYVSDSWTIIDSTLANHSNMFTNDINLTGGEGTGYDNTKLDKTYAKIDRAVSASDPGYFTAAISLTYGDVGVGSTVNPTLQIISPYFSDAANTVTYSISDDTSSFATIDANTGAITGVAEGTAKVKVTVTTPEGKSINSTFDVEITTPSVAQAEEGSTLELPKRSEHIDGPALPEGITAGEAQTIYAMPDVAGLNAQAEASSSEGNKACGWLVDSGLAQQIVLRSDLDKVLHSVYDEAPDWELTLTPLYQTAKATEMTPEETLDETIKTLIGEDEENALSEEETEVPEEPDSNVQTDPEEEELPEEINYAGELLSYAKKELGTSESTTDFVLNEDGAAKGYTKYGAHFGLPYSDWCAMFVGYGLDQIRMENIPFHAACQSWINMANSEGLYRAAAEYIPAPGDIVFMDFNEDASSDHAGIVFAFDMRKEVILTVEGNYHNGVSIVERPFNSMIMGYIPVSEDGYALKISVPEAPHTHRYSDTVVVPTCTEVGYTLHECTCGDSYIDNEVAALEHSFGEWVTITEPTEEAEGLQERSCINCTAKETSSLDKLIPEPEPEPEIPAEPSETPIPDDGSEPVKDPAEPEVNPEPEPEQEAQIPEESPEDPVSSNISEPAEDPAQLIESDASEPEEASDPPADTESEGTPEPTSETVVTE